MYNNDIIIAMEESADDLFNAIFGMQDAVLNKKPAPDKWSIKEILAHLFDSELVYSYRLRKLAAEPNSKLQAYDQDLWAKNLEYKYWDFRLLTDSFRILRINTVFLLKNIKSEQWNNKGIHEERGEMTFTQIAEFLANHTKHHVEQIKKIKEAA